MIKREELYTRKFLHIWNICKKILSLFDTKLHIVESVQTRSSGKCKKHFIAITPVSTVKWNVTTC